MQSGKRRGSSFLVVIALLVGVALGFCSAATTSTTPKLAKAEREKAAKRPPADVGEAASLKALRARIAELERRLRESEARRNEAETNKVAVGTQGEQPRPGPGSRDWMENLKKNDPERYTQMTNRFAQFRRRRAERQRRNLDFLASIDTSTMSASAKKTHAALQAAIARREEIDNRVHFGEMTDEERKSAIAEIMASERELRRLRQAERSNLFEATANSLGFEGDDAKEIVSTLNEVIDATDSSWRNMGPTLGAPPPRPGNGGR